MADMTPRPCVVLLTGGALPMKYDDNPHPNDIELALERAGVAGELGPLDATLARTVAAEAYKGGWHNAAREHRVVAVYVIDDGAEAARFAEFLTREIDPAHVMRARSALAELMTADEEHRTREGVPY
jgi:hypothetical protein